MNLIFCKLREAIKKSNIRSEEIHCALNFVARDILILDACNYASIWECFLHAFQVWWGSASSGQMGPHPLYSLSYLPDWPTTAHFWLILKHKYRRSENNPTVFFDRINKTKWKDDKVNIIKLTIYLWDNSYWNWETSEILWQRNSTSLSP